MIPARGGSKRIPGKNIRPFLGKPIIAYSIETAIKSKLFDEVMVSTDDKQIGDTAMKFGASIPFFRSETNANDFATTMDVIEEVLAEYQSKGKSFDNVCCLYPCAPLITPESLIRAFNTLGKNIDSVVPIVQYSFPIQRAFKISGKTVQYMRPEHEKTRSQDLEPAYHDAGQFYFFKTQVVLKKKTLIPKKTGYLELSELEVQDIDYPIDWDLAELKYRLKTDGIS